MIITTVTREAQLMLTTRATRLEVNQCHQTRYHSIH